MNIIKRLADGLRKSAQGWERVFGSVPKPELDANKRRMGRRVARESRRQRRRMKIRLDRDRDNDDRRIW